MAVNFNKTIKTLQRAINSKGHKILYGRKQWYSEAQQRPVNIYVVSRQIDNPKTGKHEVVQLFSTYSQVQLVLYLRDYWYTLNDIPLPTDNEMWAKIKEQSGITFDK